MFRLTPEEVRSLVSQPESGMGYQVVEATTQDFVKKRGIVFNAELLTLDEDRRADQRLMGTKSAPEALTAANSTAGKFRSFSVVSDPRMTVLKCATLAAGGASDAAEEGTREGDKFYRFSAFTKDRRIAADKSLTPGTYATTEEDGGKVKTGKEAVERYALPNDDPASNRFAVKPRKDTRINKGIVQPANGHKGGGVEVIFTNGTQRDTVALPPTKLPDM